MMRTLCREHKFVNSSLKCCTGSHLVLSCAAIVWLMPSGSIALVFDQLTETFEYIFSPLPLTNAYMLSNAAAEAMALQLIAIFFVTAVPSYGIGYPLFLRYFNKVLK
jgi:hypothetical protein